MSTWMAVLAIGLGSLALRLLPLITTRRLPERLTVAAGAGGLSVLAGFTVRSVLEYTDPGTPYAVVVAVVAVGAGVFAAFRGRGVLPSTVVGLVVYLALATTLGAAA